MENATTARTIFTRFFKIRCVVQNSTLSFQLAKPVKVVQLVLSAIYMCGITSIILQRQLIKNATNHVVILFNSLKRRPKQKGKGEGVKLNILLLFYKNSSGNVKIIFSLIFLEQTHLVQQQRQKKIILSKPKR